MAYTTAQAKQVDETRAVIIFTGDSGEQTVVREMPIGVDKGVWVYDRLAELNAKRVVTTTKPVSEGEVITPTAPTPPALTPQQAYDYARSLVARDAQDLALGIGDAGNATVVAHLDAAKTAWDAVYNSKG